MNDRKNFPTIQHISIHQWRQQNSQNINKQKMSTLQVQADAHLDRKETSSTGHQVALLCKRGSAILFSLSSHRSQGEFENQDGGWRMRDMMIGHQYSQEINKQLFISLKAQLLITALLVSNH